MSPPSPMLVTSRCFIIDVDVDVAPMSMLQLMVLFCRPVCKKIATSLRRRKKNTLGSGSFVIVSSSLLLLTLVGLYIYLITTLRTKKKNTYLSGTGRCHLAIAVLVLPLLSFSSHRCVCW